LPEKYDNRKIEEIYSRQVDVVHRVCLSYVKSAADAEDCVSDTFVKLMKTRPEFLNEEHERAWLIRVAMNVCKDSLKRAAPLNYEDYAATLHAPDDSERRDVLDAVRALPDELRTVVSLYFYEGYTHAEVAEILGISESTVRRHIEKSKTLLKDVLSPESTSERQVSEL
jgi:RNA polymerase sigma-70 factor (ECF subfamily)